MNMSAPRYVPVDPYRCALDASLTESCWRRAIFFAVMNAIAQKNVVESDTCRAGRLARF